MATDSAPIDPTKPHKAGNGWRHGDLKDVAYLFVWKAWKKPIEDYNLNREPEP